jgi:hypothetical protein
LIKGLSARAVLSMVIVGAVATGCTTGGTATPKPTSATATEQTSKTTTSTKPSAGGDSLADFDPCAVLNSVAAQLKLTEIEEEGGDTCIANYSSTVSFSLAAHPELGIAETVGGQPSDIAIGPRKAKLVKSPTTTASCLVAVEVTATSRVDVGASANASLDEACDAASKVATAIEPKLPK